MTDVGRLFFYVVYFQPELPGDMPWRCREFEIDHATKTDMPLSVIAIAQTHEALLALLPLEADFCFPREAGDQPEVVESWIAVRHRAVSEEMLRP